MKLKILAVFSFVFFGLLSFFFFGRKPAIISPLPSNKEKNFFSPEKTITQYTPYSFEELSHRRFPPGKIKLGAITKEGDNYKTYVFTYQCEGKTISGMANIPYRSSPSQMQQNSTQDKSLVEKFPVIILLRGYAPREGYHIGLGTEKSANYFAANGFLTLAPDFLGYGYSDWEDQDILLARFNRPVEVLCLLASLGSLPQADTSKIGLWGHSNGGQIALSLLEITGKPYPTSLWAPVSLGFPESVLVYLGSEEVGNPVKEKITEFLKENDPRKFSITEYFSLLKSPFIIHQATADEMIKVEWTRNLVDNLKKQNLIVDFYLYPQENHNFNRYQNTGDLLRQRDLEFFKKWLMSDGLPTTKNNKSR